MLGRKDYTQDELDAARKAVERELLAYDGLADAVDRKSSPTAKAGLADLEPQWANAMTLALDRRFVHRLRKVTGKATSPLNELELLVEALMDHDGLMGDSTVIAYRPEEAVVGVAVGERVRLTRDQVEALADAVFAEIEDKFR